MSDFPFIALTAHPDTRDEAVRCIAAAAELAGPDSLRFRYQLEVDPERVRVQPPAANAGRADRLWAHTCFEAFVAPAQSPGYLELNFSPSGEWAAYRFAAYREGMAPALVSAPLLTLRRAAGRLELSAEVGLSGTGISAGRRLRIALSTVVEDREGRLSYWALRHPAGRPDFHHPEGFALALELPPAP
jgi:hypothetical protein